MLKVFFSKPTEKHLVFIFAGVIVEVLAVLEEGKSLTSVFPA